MRITEDIHKVMDGLRKSVDASGNINLAYMLKEVVLLFERVKMMLPTTNEEERKELFQTMAEMHQFLMDEVKRLASKTGLSEQQMLMYSENPDNFTKEQWALLGEVKNKMGQQAQEIRHIMQGFKAPEITEKTPSSKKKASGSKKGGKKAQLRA